MAEENTGRTVPHYRIIEKIGSGGMGVVYRAEDTKLKHIVALKFLTRGALADDREKKRFMHEAQAAAALDHSNICTIYEIEEEGDDVFISMAYIEGKTLGDKTGSDPLPLELELILDKALEKDPKNRYGHADELLTDLRRLQSAVAAGSSHMIPAVKERRRRRWYPKIHTRCLPWPVSILCVAITI